MLEAGLLTALGVIWILSRLNLKRVAGYAFAWDVGLTALLTFLFIGTFAGMVTGMLAGLIISIFLTGVKKTVGAERLKLKREVGDSMPRMKWEKVE